VGGLGGWDWVGELLFLLVLHVAYEEDYQHSNGHHQLRIHYKNYITPKIAVRNLKVKIKQPAMARPISPSPPPSAAPLPPQS
jgi:hypothetical protein